MKKSRLYVLLAMVFMLIATLGVAAEKSAERFTLGSEAYVCNCGEGCPCHTISNNPGTCSCGKELIKAKVVKVGKGEADFIAEGWDNPRTFKTVGKYACACGPECPCKTISQNPGKCTCGKEMKAVN